VLSPGVTRLGYQVRATAMRRRCLKWVSEGEGDLVVTDVVMPTRRVQTCCRASGKQRPKLPIIVMSAQNNLITAVNARSRGLRIRSPSRST